MNLLKQTSIQNMFHRYSWTKFVIIFFNRFKVKLILFQMENSFMKYISLLILWWLINTWIIGSCIIILVGRALNILAVMWVSGRIHYNSNQIWIVIALFRSIWHWTELPNRSEKYSYTTNYFRLTRFRRNYSLSV